MFFNGDTFWSAEFGPPQGLPFARGAYENAQRFPLADPDRPSLDVSGDGRGCNILSGRFEVLDILTDATGDIGRLAVDFEQHCEGGASALRGQVRINHIETNPPVAAAGADQTVQPNASVVLDATASTDDQGITQFRWVQVAGPAVTLSGAETSRATFVAPPSEASFGFRLVVVDGRELTGADTVQVSVRERSAGGGAPSPAWLAVFLLLGAMRRVRLRALVARGGLRPPDGLP